MIPKAVVAHRLPGRLRLSIPEKRGDADYFGMLAERVRGREGVTQVKVNPRAASILLEHSGPGDELLSWAAAQQLLALDAPDAGAERPGLLSAGAASIRLVSGRDINPLFMAGVAFLGMGVIQAMRGQVMVPAATAFWYAISVFPQLYSVAAVVPARPGKE